MKKSMDKKADKKSMNTPSKKEERRMAMEAAERNIKKEKKGKK